MTVSRDFYTAAEAAIARAKEHPDRAIAYAAHVVPVYVDTAPEPEQARAGGCASCTYLGLWASSWPGYPPVDHGLIWLFETGIRQHTAASLTDEVHFVLVHELGHALQRDHVLDEMKAKGLLDPYGHPLTGHAAGCGCEDAHGRP